MRKAAQLKVEDTIALYASGIEADHLSYVESVLRLKINDIAELDVKICTVVADETKMVTFDPFCSFFLSFRCSVAVLKMFQSLDHNSYLYFVS
jgi:hypothetical protein